MKKIMIDTSRRNFFTKFSLGTLSAGLMSMIPLKIFGSEKRTKQNSERQISISIDPLAVKRSNAARKKSGGKG